MVESGNVIVLGDGPEADEYAAMYHAQGAAEVSVVTPGCKPSLEGSMPCRFVHVVSAEPGPLMHLLDLAAEYNFPVGVPLNYGETAEELERFVIRCESRKVPLMMLYPPLYASPFVRFMHHVATGITGAVKSASVRTPGPGCPLSGEGGNGAGDTNRGIAYLSAVMRVPLEWDSSDPDQLEDGGGQTCIRGCGGTGEVAVEIQLTSGAPERLFSVSGEASTLELVESGDHSVNKARRNGYSRELANFDRPDGIRDTVKAALRFANDRTGTVANGHTALLLRQNIERTEQFLERLRESTSRELSELLEKRHQSFMEVEVMQKVPIRRRATEADDLPVFETKLDVATRCNQNCVFCFSQEAEPACQSRDQYAGLFAYLKARGIDGVVFSGGEPTLVPELPEIIAVAVEAGLLNVTLETNAIQFRSRGLADRYRQAGLQAAFVSLHSPDGATVDRITGTPGSLTRTVDGVKNLLAADIEVHLNCVVNRYNHPQLSQLVRFVADELPGATSLTFSYVAPLGRALNNRDVVPRITETVSNLATALKLAEELGVIAFVPGRCGIPHCLLPGLERFFLDYRMRNIAPATHHRSLHDRVKPAFCGRCRMDRHCQGLWASYARMYGTGELTPLISIDDDTPDKEPGR